MRKKIFAGIMLFFLIGCWKLEGYAAFPEDPPNDPEYDRSEETTPPGSIYNEQWYLFGFEPASTPGAGVSGISADLAWKISIGHKGIINAIVDSGIVYGDPDLENQYFLNRGELPPPQSASLIALDPYDANGDGVFNLKDYTGDSRVYDANKNGTIDVGDLIIIFSNGIDEDGNDFTDDISGWDFLQWDNYPEDNTLWQGYSHGTDSCGLACAEGNNGIGKIGAGPNVTILPIRVSNSFMVEINRWAMGVLYAVDMGAKSIGTPTASIDNSTFAQQVCKYAHKKGCLIIGSAGDEGAYHHHFPAIYEQVLYITALVPNSYGLPIKTTSYLNYSNATNSCGHTHLAVPCGATSQSVAMFSGAVALVYSRGQELVEQGLLTRDLTGNEVKQILCMSADDINLPPNPDQYPSQPGWEHWFGYGRPNLRKALELVTPTTIPPEVIIEDPGWFEIIDPIKMPILKITGYVSAKRAPFYDFTVEYGIGIDPLEFTEILTSRGNFAPVDGTIAYLNLAQIPLDFMKVVENYDDFALTIRVRATDGYGNIGEDRKQIFLVHDGQWLPGFPKKIGCSGESAPVLYDMDNDGCLDIVFGTADGYVHILNHKGEELPGWPVATDLYDWVPDGAGNRQIARWIARHPDIKPASSPIIWSVAVGDLEKDGYPEVVAASVGGKVYVWNHNGILKTGFPVSVDPENSNPAYHNHEIDNDRGIFTSPALEDMDGDGDLEIIVAGGDSWVYIWHHNGNPLNGWPVLVSDLSQEKPQWRRIMASPAVGDIDGDGKMEVVVGSQEAYLGSSRVYAFEDDGKLKDGWPIKTITPWGDLIPFIGAGVSASPILIEMKNDGTLIVGLSSVVGWPAAYRHEGTLGTTFALRKYGEFSNSTDNPCVVVMSAYSAGDIDSDGDFDFVCGTSGLGWGIAQMAQGIRKYWDHQISVWDIKSGEFLPYFPVVMEDADYFCQPAVADIDGDGYGEILPGTGGYILHAFNHQGKEPEGWPKFNGGWLFATPAIGDIDGDGFLEVVVITREGYLFAYNTKAPLAVNGKPSVQWGQFGCNSRKTNVIRLSNLNPEPPIIAMAGYLQTDLDAINGGLLNIFAWVPDEEANEMELFYQGIPTGLTVPKINQLGVYLLKDVSIAPPLPARKFLLELKAKKFSNIESFPWPYLNVGE